jgi:hypothetical protein
MRYILVVALALACGTVNAGDCVNGTCGLRNKVVTTTKEVVRVPVQVTKKTVELTRNGLRRVGSKVRSVVR